MTCGTCAAPMEAHEAHGRLWARCGVCGMLHSVKKREDGTMAVEQDVRAGDLTPARKELLETLRRLEVRQQEVLAQKKSALKDFRDQLKDISDEMRDTLAQLEQTA